MIGVGVLGANPDRSWAAWAHVPALASRPEFSLVAVATTRPETAERAREQFGARHAFTNPAELAAHPDVDLVVVTVKVPHHAELVRAALAAGKHVYCEWPLGRTLAEAEELAELADKAGVRAFTGLQGRFAPAVVRARELIAEGRIGRVLSAHLHSARGKGGDGVPAWAAYTVDAANGAGLVEVMGGHTLDLVQHLLGPMREISTRTAIRTPESHVAETGERLAVTSPDQFLATAELDGGAVVSVHLHDGETGPARTRLEITGTEGTLALHASSADPLRAQAQIGRLELLEGRAGVWQQVPLPEPELPMAAVNIAGLYRQLAEDLRTGSSTTPDFHTAVALHRLLVR